MLLRNRGPLLRTLPLMSAQRMRRALSAGAVSPKGNMEWATLSSGAMRRQSVELSRKLELTLMEGADAVEGAPQALDGDAVVQGLNSATKGQSSRAFVKLFARCVRGFF
jgi:hypothetical protein